MKYTPRQGDIIKMDFDPTKGHEQQGFRPAVVVSGANYHGFSADIAMVCPITSKDRGFPLHPQLDGRTETTGVIMTDQVKALDLAQRNVKFVERLPLDILEEVCDIVSGFSKMDIHEKPER